MNEELEFPVTPSTVWFAPRCCVVSRGDNRDILVGGILVATIGPKDTAMRNVLLAGLAEEPEVHLGELARGFGLSTEAVRLIRRLNETGGFPALLQRKRGGGKVRRTAVEQKARKLFDAGRTVNEVHAAVKNKVSRSTVVNIRKDWAKEKAQASTRGEPEVAVKLPAKPSGVLPLVAVVEETVETSASKLESASPEAFAGDASERRSPSLGEGRVEETVQSGARAPESAATVQHVGAWLLIAMVHALGLHGRAAAAAGGRVSQGALRLAMDAVVAALALGERCVEGVRRLATSSASALLLSSRAPSADWTRRTLGRFAQDSGGAALHLGMAREYLGAAKADARDEGPVFYVDNHMRPYTGKQVVRRGWRMQDKRARPGATDYYVHDEDGRPVGRVTAPHHGALTDFLSPLARLLRLALPEDGILLAFDRAGAFPSQMAELRDEGFEFVTYERRPYALLAKSEFTEEVIIDGEMLLWCEPREKNLGGGRGRVRRICVRTEDGRQINLVAVSRRPAARLIEVMRGRWTQENGFKHGKERWGLNQLDGRTVVPYAPETIIRNPARRRLDQALRIARVSEGLARAELARLPERDARRKKLEAQLNESLERQRELEKLRPSTPTRAPLEETELAGKLVHHELEYKLVVDTIRIACANAESELATLLAPALPRATEAKKTLANLFAAPGRVHVGAKAITVTLRPAGTPTEMNAFKTMLKDVNHRRLKLPGDSAGRALRFRIDQL